MLALGHIKIVDMSISGPGHLTTQYLADMGADVIRVMPVPDSGRANNPISGAAIAGKQYLAYDHMNRNKRCMAINLKLPEGRETFMNLVKTVDVIVEGGRPGAAKRMGVDYDTVKKINQRIIYCSLSGYGQDGPYAHLPGHDINYIGYAGILSVVGELDGPPVIPDNFIADFAGASMHGIIGITVALLAREKTGKGQFVDISFTDAAMALNATSVGLMLSSGIQYDRGGMPTCGAYPAYSVYQAKDGKWLTLGCVEPWFWQNACKVLGLEQYIEDGTISFLAYLSKRPDNPKYNEIRKALDAKFKTKNRDEWVGLLQSYDVPAGPVYEMDEVVANPHLNRRMVIEADIPEVGKVKQVGFPIKFSETPAAFRKCAPAFGEDTDEILKALGYSTAKINNLRESKAIA